MSQPSLKVDNWDNRKLPYVEKLHYTHVLFLENDENFISKNGTFSRTFLKHYNI